MQNTNGTHLQSVALQTRLKQYGCIFEQSALGRKIFTIIIMRNWRRTQNARECQKEKLYLILWEKKGRVENRTFGTCLPQESNHWSKYPLLYCSYYYNNCLLCMLKMNQEINGSYLSVWSAPQLYIIFLFVLAIDSIPSNWYIASMQPTYNTSLLGPANRKRSMRSRSIKVSIFAKHSIDPTITLYDQVRLLHHW